MDGSARVSSLLFWNLFLLWETAPAALEADGDGRLCAQPLESALPSAVDATSEGYPAMAPSGFTHWF